MHEIQLRDHTAPLSFIHLTDTHLLDDADAMMHGISTRDTLEDVLGDALRRYHDLDFILITGDISQTGSSESYTQFQSIIASNNRTVYAVPGNHDNPGLLKQIIPSCPHESLQTVNLGHITLILLNSHVANHHGGMISALQLQQLDSLLASSTAQFHIIAIHHPPVLINSKWLDELGLKNGGQLMDVITRHGHSSLLLCGHIHQQLDQQLGNIRLLATPSTCYQFVARSDTMQREERPRPGYRYIRLNTNQEIQTQVRSIEWAQDYADVPIIQNL